VVPPTLHEGLLEAIRDEIEKHNLSIAETKLKELPPAVLSEAKVKSFVAILWNNLGLQQERLNGTRVSVRAFKNAADLDESNPVILMNLAHAYWEQRDRALNAEFLMRLTKVAPDEPFPHLAMADRLQEQDELEEAAKHLGQATDLAKHDPGLQSYLATVTAKIRRTQSVESHMAAKSSTHFVVRFDGEEDQNTWISVLEILEEAYREIGQKFGHFPSEPIIVVLHAKDSFQGATGSPAWADGLYDPALGRIQIPTQGATTDRKWLASVLRHEYVHALLHDRLGTSSGALPTWLNEGLAMQLAGDAWPELDRAMSGGIKVIPLIYLEGSWGTLPASTSAVAYLEANSATRYLIERWGMAGVNELLKDLQTKSTMAAALQNKLFVSYEQFNRQWLESFERNRL
jgi:tetratricopeptide (TPR) repeat protein